MKKNTDNFKKMIIIVFAISMVVVITVAIYKNNEGITALDIEKESTDDFNFVEYYLNKPNLLNEEQEAAWLLWIEYSNRVCPNIIPDTPSGNMGLSVDLDCYNNWLISYASGL